jgi:indole-3-glycerol phosphate synthase
MLDGILASTREEVEQRKRERPLTQIVEAIESATEDRPTVGGSSRGSATRDSATRGSATRGSSPRDSSPRRLRDALSKPGLGVIAEIKRRSPSAGTLRSDLDVAALAAAYEAGGASALSVLTEGPNFAGSLQDLETARGACGLPILRKDFVVDPYQLHEALEAGADAVLLIVAALTPDELAELHETARSLGLDTLVEVHDEAELETALSVGADLVGVNNRDLRDFSVDVQRTFALLKRMPAGVRVVSESGIKSPEQMRELEQAGVAAALIGEALVRAEDPGAALEALLGNLRTPTVS